MTHGEDRTAVHGAARLGNSLANKSERDKLNGLPTTNAELAMERNALKLRGD